VVDSVTLAIASAIALLATGGPASAAPNVPKGEPFKIPVPAGALCEFELLITGTDGTATRTTLPDGTTIVTGPFVATVTNVDTGESKTYNVSGPTFRSASNFLTITGPALILQPDRPGLIVTNGRAQFQEDQPIPEGSLKGRIAADVCADLSSE
jgi:hypothetical protein